MGRARLGVMLGYAQDFLQVAQEVPDFEAAGVELFGVSETYSFDAVSQLGYLAALTKSAALASDILPIYSRTPALLAMTAAGLDHLTGGRFELGLGSSGAQVVEGFHGVPFDAPLGRTREIIEICRKVWRRETLEHHGRYYELPLPPSAPGAVGAGKALRLINHPDRPAVPVHIAALSPKSVAQAAEIADGWTPIFYHPERAASVWGDALAKGAAKRSPELGKLDVIVPVPLYLGEFTDYALMGVRQQIALYVGGMGARGRNFYYDLAVRYGYEQEAAQIQSLFLAGEKDDAAFAVPEELARAVSLIGSRDEVEERVEALLAAGATTLSVQPLDRTHEERVEALRVLREILDR
ncbi:LLM class F420-dependent oxidoreductase [Gryllotalpicola ginsengisoli]|uniref:LLM class F420-dependent oxidoreductase n=1 Tax=Gryllotalpicola ginsengisoli TaxID=444608 RepID=UPI0003B706AB|nr:LLM class F420-dependent oxidoreductase [Gryllotalpicola ginsengisoli]